MTTGTIGRHLVRLAGVLALAGFTVGCASNAQQAATVAPAGFGKDPVSRAERLVSYCDRLADKGEMVTALGLCARAHEINPDDPEAVMKIASILHKLDRKQAAEQTYVSLLEQHPKHHEARYSLGKLYMEMGDTSMAAAQFNYAIQSNPKDPRPYNALGIIRDQAGEHQAAQALYRSALKHDPNNHSLRNNLGLSLALNGQRDEAIEVLAALAVDPEAHQTVLRNLEAAYASRSMAAPAGMETPAAGAAVETPSAAPTVQPVKSEALEPEEGMAEPMAPKAPALPAKEGAPTPLFVPQPSTAGQPRQSSTRQLHESSAILAAAERLMAPPEWADFEPGALIGQEPAAKAPATGPSAGPAAGSAVEAPAQSGELGEISVDPMELGAMFQPGEVSLSMLLVSSSSGSA